MDIKPDDTNSELENNSATGEEALENKDTSNNDDLKDTESKEDLKKDEPKKEDEPKTFESAAESTGGKFDTTTLIAASAKLEATIESLESNTPNEDEFYKNLDTLIGQIEFNRTANRLDQLKRELKSFDPTKDSPKDDCMECLTIAVTNSDIRAGKKDKPKKQRVTPRKKVGKG